MLRLQRIVGGLLVLGLLGGAAVAFAVTQSLKAEPPTVLETDFSRARSFSPGCDCGVPTARFSLTLSRAGELSVRITTPGGRPVRTLLAGARRAGIVALEWDGRDQSGNADLRDGPYQVQVRFGRGRWRAAPNAIVRVDTQPAAVVVAGTPGRTIAFGAAGDDGALTYEVTTDEPATATTTVFAVASDGAVDEVWRSAEPLPLAPGEPATLVWPAARRVASEPAPDGTYLAGVEVRDAAGNVSRVPAAFSVDETAPALPVRVRSLEITPAGRVLTIDRQIRVEQRLLVDDLPGIQVGERDGDPATPTAPPARAGLYGLQVFGSRGSTWGWQTVAGRAQILVVLPTFTWQAANTADGDLDGLPDSPPQPLRLDRPLAGGARAVLDALLTSAGPALAAAGRSGAITDSRLEASGVPRAARLLVVPEMRVWTPRLIAVLQTFARRGGRIALIASPLDRRGERVRNTLVVEPREDVVTIDAPRVTRGLDAAVRSVAAIRRARVAPVP